MKNNSKIFSQTMPLLKSIKFFIDSPKFYFDKKIREGCKNRKQLKEKCKDITPKLIKVKLSQIEPSHPVDDDLPCCLIKTNNRVELLRLNTVSRFNIIDDNVVNEFMKSTCNIKLIYSKKLNKYVSLAGSSRTIALKTYFQEIDLDPECVFSFYNIDQEFM